MPIKATVTQGGPRARSDAIRNRTLLLKTADKLLAERGLDLTFHELAAAAGVGVGTVYRHFADKNALLGALIERRFEAARDLLLTAEKIEDPIDALREAITRMCEFQFTDRGLWQALLTDANRYGPLANELLTPVSARIADRARATGRIRDDFSVTDFAMIYLFTGTLSQATGPVRPELWRRYVDATLDGFMLDQSDRRGASVAAPTEAEIDDIIAVLGKAS